MTGNNPFPTVEEEARRAADELAAMKEAVKELLAKLTLVEKRLAALVPAAASKTVPKVIPSAVPQKAGSAEETFKALLAIYKTGVGQAESELAKFKRDELAELAKYTGESVTSKSNKKDLTAMVMGKLRESKIINTGIN